MMISQGTIPVMDPKINGKPWPLPGLSYFSCRAPKNIIDALTEKIPTSAAKSDTPVS